MERIQSNVLYWLVEHPVVKEFEWKEGETWGSSPRFVATTLIAYTSVTAFLYKISISSKSPPAKTPPSSPSTTSFLHLFSAFHSLLLVILSTLMTVGCTLSTFAQKPNNHWLFCFPSNETPPRGPVFFWTYVFYLSKISEFVDTLLILLSKSKRRLSFLHVYHHSVALVGIYMWLQTSQSLIPFGVITNSSVHILMYTYYMLCALGKRPWWKRLVTDVQILQFILSFLVSFGMLWYHFTGKGCSGFGSWCVSAFISGSLLFLFYDFHTKTYAKGSEKRADYGGKENRI
ncbi:PREDICTED: elongation of fatty acids protein 3-like [Nelumbo nucifera]|uniref:very-long-chain 3-oxoacyl-CoA synthase n=1 Tax=Nelumbo nucifera TaxID=4432 RepID=A0A1U8B149_NELNU|nr:PREDICTED: elongation of fatty acids protein 3-like [Nelumbo nucifera]